MAVLDLAPGWARQAASRARALSARRRFERARRDGLRRQTRGAGGSSRLPRLSIVTPSFNQGRFLERCIRSVLDQGYPDLEYVVIDGGSTDESVEIIRRHQDRLAYWVSEPDSGQADAINKGIRRTGGELVAWLNADDFYLPGAFAAAAEAFGRDPSRSFYYGDGFRVAEDETPVGAFFPEGPQPYDEPAMVFGLNYVLQPAAFINRACLERAGDLDPSLHYGLDTDLWIRLARVAAPAPIAAHLAASREHAATKTGGGSFARVEELRRIAEKYAEVPMTPGVLCYFLDTLDRLAAERADVFPPRFRRQIHVLWAATSRLMHAYGARPDGFPRRRATAGEPPRSPKSTGAR
jgi:glycosyltransferase involved in cell wall biosynthesis